MVFQLDTNGELDLGFSNDGVTNGWQELEFIPGSSSYITDVHITDNGDIYLLGDVLDQGRNWALAKLTANGPLAPGFGGDGTVSLDLDMPIDLSAALAWQSDGKLIVVGSTGNLTDGQTCVARYLSNGTLDNTFGTGGLACVQIEDLSFPADVTIDAMGRIVVVGTSYNEFMAPSTYVMRMLSGLNVGVMEFSILEDILNVYPNPIAETTTLRYTLAEAEELTIALQDLQGRVLATYLNGKDMPAGEHTQTITMPSDLASGDYLLVFSSPKGKMSVQVTKAN
ncbi:MAG: T9SS type A sorting domain-containing protein [Flavobacteriales bacterium]|nr:T9SS type A sorting domain-containing protein [Flavobacteriales bacterium]